MTITLPMPFIVKVSSLLTDIDTFKNLIEQILNKGFFSSAERNVDIDLLSSKNGQ